MGTGETMLEEPPRKYGCEQKMPHSALNLLLLLLAFIPLSKRKYNYLRS